jgi:hypothetical protein
MSTAAIFVISGGTRDRQSTVFILEAAPLLRSLPHLFLAPALQRRKRRVAALLRLVP